MKIETAKRGDVCIVALDGKLGFGESASLLSNEFDGLVDDGERLFVFDMIRVPWLDSSGIGEVVACYRRVRRLEGVVKLVMRGKSRSQFTINQLEKMFEVFDEVEAAVASFETPDGGGNARS